MTKTLYIAAAALLAAIGINAQSAPNWAYIPTACESQCSQTIEASYLCSEQHAGDSLNTYACFCADYPSDAASCSTCLNSNNAAALANLLTSTQTACPQAEKQCFFACSFDTCASTDISCQCSGEYLQNIYNCGSCNTANGNTGATQLADWQALRDSCANQNFTGAAQSFSTRAAPTPSNTASYSAPRLTATGGGLAATGSASALGAVTDGASSTASGAVSASSSIRAAASSVSSAGSASRASASSSGSASRSASGTASSVSGAAASASSSRSAGMMVGAPAGGVLAFIGAIVALL